MAIKNNTCKLLRRGGSAKSKEPYLSLMNDLSENMRPLTRYDVGRLVETIGYLQKREEDLTRQVNVLKGEKALLQFRYEKFKQTVAEFVNKC